MKIVTFLLSAVIFGQSILVADAQSANNFSFDKAAIIVPNGNSTKQIVVVVSFLDNEVQIKSKKDGVILKAFKYSDIKAAEYSYTEKPRWKEGLGLGAASLVFPPLFLVALPLGFTKTKNHWFTFRSDKDFAALKLNKRIRKLFIPTFETKTGVTVEGKGADK